jgi:ribulose-phosphate 3-epimerase
MTVQLAPSMMCADILRLPETLNAFKEAGIHWLHVDVMDGVFVPNIQLGADYVRQLRGLSDIPLDIHLMICDPDAKIEWFDPQPGEYVSVHAEAAPHLQRVLKKIRDTGAKPMAALNPATPIHALEYVLDDIDAVLIMTVNPGYAGQALIPATLKKIEDLRTFLDERGYGHIEIEVDGNVSIPNGQAMTARGANILVLGSSALFKEGVALKDALTNFRKAIS